MGMIKLIILSLAVVLFTACGSDDSTDEVVAEVNDIEIVDTNNEKDSILDLQVELKSKAFYVIEDGSSVKNMYKMIFDENLSSWDIEIYSGSYSSTPTNTVTNNIAVTTNTLTNNGGYIYKRTDEISDYINLVAIANPLVVLKMFASAEEAEKYYKISLEDKLRAKEFFVVQNDLSARSLFKITVDENNTQWDIVSYDANYAEESISSTAAGLAITVSDSNLTDSGGASFWLNTIEEEYFKLVSYGNSLVTLKFFETSDLALSYYTLTDLRTELKGKSFYAVGNNSQEKQLITFTFDDALTQWEFNQYTNDYNETAVNSGINTITVTEDTLFENEADSLKLLSKNSDYIELQSLTNSLSTYRLYNSSELAKTYYSE